MTADRGPRAPRARLLIACPGVGHVARGFESFAEECFAALRDRPELDVVLAGGRGPSGGGRLTARVPGPAHPLLEAVGRGARRDGYWVQQLLFAAALAPVLAARRPDVVLLSDWVLASALGRWRRLSRQRFKLLLSNGSPGGPRFDWSVDHVQHLTPGSLQIALEGGEPAGRHTLLPLGVAMPPAPAEPGAPERTRLRELLGLPPGAELLLCVAALNRWHKRIDYLVREVAALERPPHLVLLGQREPETRDVLRLASTMLAPGGWTARTVPQAEVAAYYRAADMFVLPSLHEAFGRALVEALSHGLPVVAHDAGFSRFALGGHGFTGDLSRPGALAALLDRARRDGGGAAAARERHRFARERFGWDALAPRYAQLVRACARS